MVETNEQVVDRLIHKHLDPMYTHRGIRTDLLAAFAEKDAEIEKHLPNLPGLCEGIEDAMAGRVHALEDVDRIIELERERDSLRAQLAEAQRERDEQRRRYKDELAALHDTRRDLERLLDLATAQVERLREALRPLTAQFYRTTVGHKEGTIFLLASQQEHIDKVLAEMPDASLAAVREQARREALEEAARKADVRAAYMVELAIASSSNAIKCCRLADGKQWELRARWLRELAAQPAKEPQP